MSGSDPSPATDRLLRRVHAGSNDSLCLPVRIAIGGGGRPLEGVLYLSLGQAESLALELAEAIEKAGGRIPRGGRAATPQPRKPYRDGALL